MTTGDVTIQIVDGAGAAVVVPSQSVQLVIGCSTAGTPGQVVASKSSATIQSVFGYGPLAEYCCMAIAAGATVLAMRAATVTPGYLNADAVNAHGGTTPTMSGATDTTGAPIEITAAAHGLHTGQIVTIAGTTGQTLANGTWVITRTGADTFTIPVNGDSAHDYTGAGTIKTTGLCVNPTTSTPRLSGLSGFAQSTSVAGRPTVTALLGVPIVTATGKTVTTLYPHDLHTGETVTISGVSVNTTINASQVVTVVDARTFTVPIGSGSGTGGTVVGPNGAYDDAYIALAIVNDGNSGSGKAVGSSGIQYRLSFDAGRNFGPIAALGTATSIALAGKGITLQLGAGSFYTGDVAIFSTTGMATAASNAAPAHGVAQSLTAAAASPYGVTGWGSLHILGAWSEANVATVAADTTGTLDTIAGQYVYTRGIFSARDASPPVIWGGTGETESVWMSDGSVGIVNTFSVLSAKRGLVSGGHYNMPSAIAGIAGAPSYRRPGAWALAVRETLIAPQRHAGRVKDGALGNIVLDPANDALDGFVYHDERPNPGLDSARLTSYRTRIGKPGMYVANPNLMSAPGSYFTILPLGNVMDVACQIVHEVGQDEINDDLRLNANGTLVAKDASTLQSAFDRALTSNMVNKAMISNESTVVDTSTNVAATHEVNVSVSIGARGYVLSEAVTIGFATPQ